MRNSRLLQSLLLTIVVLIGVVGCINYDSRTVVAADKESQPQRIVFEARIQQVAPNAIRFRGGFVLPTTRETVYVRETKDGETAIARTELEKLTEEVDDEPYLRPPFSGGLIQSKIPSFKLGGRVRCEYIPSESATKVVVLAESPEERRSRWNEAWAAAPRMGLLGNLQPSDPFNHLVSLKAHALPFKEALAVLAQNAQIPLEIDIPALTRAGVDSNCPITTEIIDQPLQVALMHLVDWRELPNVFCRDLNFNGIRVTTIDAYEERRKSMDLPEWLRPPKEPRVYPAYPTGFVDGQITSLHIYSATDEILSQLKTLPKLRELQIDIGKSVTPTAFAALAELDSVEELSLRGSPSLSAADADHIAQYVGRMKSLRSLNLSETGITDVGLHAISGLPLTSLTLYQEGRLTDKAMEEIARMRHMKKLAMTCYVALQELGAMQFSSSALGRLSALPELESINFAGEPVPKGLSAFLKLDSLRFDAHDRAVFKSTEFLNDDAAADLAEAAHLKYLTIERHAISSAGWWMIGNLPELRGIRATGVGDSQIKNLASHGMPKLTQLQVISGLTESNELTDRGIGNLARFTSVNRLEVCGKKFSLQSLCQLNDMTNLRSLYVYGLEQKEGYDALKSLEKLNELYLVETSISQADYNKLERALPKTRIYAGANSRWLWSIRDQQ